MYQSFAKTKTLAIVDGEAIQFGIEEKAHRVPVGKGVRTRLVRQHPDRWFRNYPYEFAPTEQLTLEVARWGMHDARLVWTDGSRRRVEECLNEFVMSLLTIASSIRRQREAEEQRREREREAARVRAEAERLRRQEAKRASALRQQVAAWRRSRLIRAFVGKVERASAQTHDQMSRDRLLQWLDWARAYADRIDCVFRPW